MYGPVTHRYHSFCILAGKESYDFRASNFSIASITSSDTGAERKATKGLAKGDWRTSNFGVVSIMSSDAGTEREVTTERASKSIADECDDSSYPKRKEKCKFFAITVSIVPGTNFTVLLSQAKQAKQQR